MIRSATLHAAEIPFETAILGMDLLNVLENLGKFGNANAASDVGVASLLASAAVKGALFNVEINTNSIPTEMGNHISEKIPSLRIECSQASRLVMHAVHDRISTN
jgi:glutamate formiminotransferase/formiminotetrahydrofolate cyclodeaminase